MITTETVNGIVKFEANGLPVVSLYCGVDPGESQRELRARACVVVLDRESSRVWETYPDEVREVETVTDPPHKAGNTESRPEDRIQNRVDEQTKRHFRRVAGVIDQLLRTGGYDVLVADGHEHELPEFLRLLPHDLHGRVAGTFSADPAASPVAEMRGSAEGIVRRYQRGQDEWLADQVLELAVAGGPAAIGLQECLWAGSMSAIETLLVRGGSARQIAADLMSEDYLAAAERFSPPPPDQGS